MKHKQKTIAEKISFEGIGLHSGINSKVTLKPAKDNEGIIFSRYVNGQLHSIPGDFHHISQSNLCTTIKSNNGKIKVLTIEHLLAAIKGNDIDNIEILVEKEEIPALDGSALEFDKIIKKAKVISQSEYKKFLSIKKHITIKKNKSIIDMYPSDKLVIECIIDFPTPIGIQKIKLGDSSHKIYEEVLKARTFCFFDDVEKMREIGLAKGGSLKNAVVIKNKTILNKNGLRTRDEFVKHKVLDMLGDFSLINYNIKAKIKAVCPGHEINKLAMQEIFSDFSNYNILQHRNKVEAYNSKIFMPACN